MTGLDLRDPKALAQRDRIFIDVYEHDIHVEKASDPDSDLVARVVVDGWDKLIGRPDNKELYDLKNDPDDRNDIAAQTLRNVQQLAKMIDAWMQSHRLLNKS